MESKEIIGWSRKVEELVSNDFFLLKCPFDNNHFLDYNIKPYKEYNKIEISLNCSKCDKSTIITIDGSGLNWRF